MSMAHDLIIDQFSSTAERQPHLTTWYAQGHSDGLGDRLLMFDNTSAPSWEILRFAPALARDRRFEAALRATMQRLESFQHPVFPAVRPIEELGHGDGLAVVSTYTQGARLSEAFKKPRSAAFAMRLIRELVPALTALQQHAGVAHGALDADRIVVTADGRLTIREHMVGPALETLGFSSARLWSDFGIVTPADALAPPLDSRCDLVQLGLVILSLMAGRRIGLADYPHKIEGLLDDLTERTARGMEGAFPALRSWLERALQLGDCVFESAREANDALERVPDGSERAGDYFAAPDSNLPAASETDEPEDAGWPPRRRGPRLITQKRLEVARESLPPVPPVAAELPPTEDDRTETESAPLPVVRSQVARVARAIAIVAAVLAIGEGLFIGRLLYARAGTPSAAPEAGGAKPPSPAARVDDRTTAGLTASLPTGAAAVLPGLAEKSGPKAPEILPAAKQKTPPAKPGDREAGAAAPALIGSQRTGGFRLSSSIEVHVLDGDRILGSSGDGPIVAPVGRHEFEFVNSAIGYRERRVVDVKPGEITSLAVTVPNGTLNINAVPWATVWIDGNSFGETPLGNLSITPGEHEIVFRHPQLGEKRQSAVVRAAATTRVSVNLQQ